MTAIVIKMAPIVNRLWAIRHAATTEALVTIALLPASRPSTTRPIRSSLPSANGRRVSVFSRYKPASRPRSGRDNKRPKATMLGFPVCPRLWVGHRDTPKRATFRFEFGTIPTILIRSDARAPGNGSSIFPATSHRRPSSDTGVGHCAKEFAECLDNQVVAFMTVESSDEKDLLGIALCEPPAFRRRDGIRQVGDDLGLLKRHAVVGAVNQERRIFTDEHLVRSG